MHHSFVETGTRLISWELEDVFVIVVDVDLALETMENAYYTSKFYANVWNKIDHLFLLFVYSNYASFFSDLKNLRN